MIDTRRWQWGPDPRFPAGNSPIRGQVWDEFSPRGDLNGGNLIPVGFAGTGTGNHPPSPFPVYPSPRNFFIQVSQFIC